MGADLGGGRKRRWPPRPRPYASLALTILLAGCAVSSETVEVRIPVAVRATPPPELVTPLEAPLPVFVAPADPQAASALTPAGEAALRQLLLEMFTRLRAWQAWAEAPAP